MAGLEAKIKGFMRYRRKKHTLRDPNNGLVDMDEIFTSHNSAPVEEKIREASRCMDCGVPFCQSDTGCPISNLIPEFKALVYADKWEEAYRTLIKTNNLPEFTGRACPAPCEVRAPVWWESTTRQSPSQRHRAQHHRSCLAGGLGGSLTS